MNEMHTVLRRGLLLLWLCAASAALHADELEIIPLKYHSAEQVIPMLRPLIEPGGALTGMQNQLVVRASRNNIEEIKRVLAGIDTQPRRLLISVRQDAAGMSERRGAEVSGTVGSGRVVISNQPGGAANERNVTARVFDSRSASDDRVSQQLQVLEGYPATINVGQSLPVPSRSVTQTINGVVIADTVAYRDATTGFDVVPRITGDRVLLEISPHRDTPGSIGPGSINVQRIVTTASGRLGEWFELGGTGQDESRQGSGILSGNAAQRQDNRRVWVKVEEVR